MFETFAEIAKQITYVHDFKTFKFNTITYYKRVWNVLKTFSVDVGKHRPFCTVVTQRFMNVFENALEGNGIVFKTC